VCSIPGWTRPPAGVDPLGFGSGELEPAADGADVDGDDGRDGEGDVPDWDPDEGGPPEPEAEREGPPAIEVEVDDDPAADFSLVPSPHAASKVPPPTPSTVVSRLRRPKVTGNIVGDHPRSLIRKS
jgi:hypothetical protein